MLNSKCKHIVQPQPKHPGFAKVLNQGRVGLYVFEVIPGVHLMTYVVYGWTNAEANDEAAARTDDLLTLIVQDLQLQEVGPKLIAGDFDGTLQSLVNFNDEIVNGRLVDIGAIASAYGGVDNDVTCKASPKANAPRRGKRSCPKHDPFNGGRS